MSSLANALRILDLLRDDSELRVVEVATQLGVSVSTAHRLLSTMREHGYLRQEPGSSRYYAGPSAVRLARRVSNERALEHMAQQPLEALSRTVGETANLQILVGSEVLFLASAEDEHRLRVAQRAGGRGHAHANAGGKVLLAALEAPAIEDLLQGQLVPLTSNTIVDMDELQAELEQVRDEGYATNVGETDSGVHAVAVPVVHADGSTIAAVSIAAPAVRLPRAEFPTILPHLRATSAAIAAAYSGMEPGSGR